MGYDIEKHVESHKFEWGMILALTSVPVASILNEFGLDRTGNLSQILLALSLILMARFGNIVALKMRANRTVRILIVYQSVIFLISIYAGAPFFGTPWAIVMTLFVLALLVVLSMSDNKFDSNYFVSRMVYFSGTFNILLTYLVTDGFSDYSNLSFSYMEGGSNRLTLSNIAFIYIVAMMCHKTESVIGKIIKAIFTFSAIINMLACTRRGMMVGILLVILFSIYEKIRCNKIVIEFRLSKLKNLVIAALILIAFITALQRFPGIKENIDRYYESLQKAVFTFWGSSSMGVDAAANNRVEARQLYFNEYLNSSTVWQFIFGRGYSLAQMDFPYLQAFWDLGLVGGFAYMYFQGILPIKLAIHHTYESGVTFLRYWTLIYLTMNFYSGVPYGYFKFIPLILLLEVTQRGQGEQYEKTKDFNG